MCLIAHILFTLGFLILGFVVHPLFLVIGVPMCCLVLYPTVMFSLIFFLYFLEDLRKGRKQI
ncbi:MAG: hypothetical protein MUF87_14850 [Anaerolineae bacterium]|jgi:hypothetical protein|nr:hypothetical protein [Anaerolineae bacterium]